MAKDQDPNDSCDFLAARLRITPALELRVLSQAFGSGCFVHVREFALTNDNEFVATQRGIAVPTTSLSALLDGVKELRSSSEEDGTVAALPLSGGREIRFSITRWQGTTKADIRQYYKSASTVEMLPTKKGIRLNLGLLAELERGIELLDRHING